LLSEVKCIFFVYIFPADQAILFLLYVRVVVLATEVLYVYSFL